MLSNLLELMDLTQFVCLDVDLLFSESIYSTLKNIPQLGQQGGGGVGVEKGCRMNMIPLPRCRPSCHSESRFAQLLEILINKCSYYPATPAPPENELHWMIYSSHDNHK